MKVDCKVFKGIEYVQVSELPGDQREVLHQTLNADLYIKILIEGKIVSGCLQYKDYLRWYQEHFPATAEQEQAPRIDIRPNLALGKA